MRIVIVLSFEGQFITPSNHMKRMLLHFYKCTIRNEIEFIHIHLVEHLLNTYTHCVVRRCDIMTINKANKQPRKETNNNQTEAQQRVDVMCVFVSSFHFLTLFFFSNEASVVFLYFWYVHTGGVNSLLALIRQILRQLIHNKNHTY